MLRHDPSSAGVTLDERGWAAVVDLVAGIPGLTRMLLEQIVREDTKQRCTLAGTRIRAAQSHSAGVADGAHVRPVDPPDVLFHGTTWRSVAPILDEGLRSGSRRHVHLSGDVETATTVGSRRGAPVVIEVAARRAAENGIRFYRAENGVWLTDGLPAAYLRLLT